MMSAFQVIIIDSIEYTLVSIYFFSACKNLNISKLCKLIKILQ